MPLDTTGLRPLDTSGLRPLGSGGKAGGRGLDTSGLTRLDTSGLTPMEPEGPGAISRGFVSGLLQQNPELASEAMEGLSHLAPEQLRGAFGDASRSLREWSQMSPEEYAPRARSLWESESLGEALTWAGEAFGQGVASTVPSIITGTAGAVTGGRVGGRAGGLVGGAAGAAVPSAALNYGEVYRALKDEGVDPERAAEVGAYAAVPMVALDTLSIGPIITRLGGIDKVRQEASRRIARRIAQEAARGAGREGITEAAQDVIKEIAVSLETDQPFWTVENLGEFVESGIAGAMVGGTIGGAAGIRPDQQAATQAPPTFQPGDRVQWIGDEGKSFAGTVTAVGRGGNVYQVQRDDGDTAMVGSSYLSAAGAPVEITPDDAASPLPTDAIRQGKEIIQDALEGRQRPEAPVEAPVDLPQGAVPADVLLGAEVEQQTPPVDSSAPISDPVAEPGAQPFQVTAEWQPVPEGAVLPGGVQVTMDMETGQQMARQAPEAAPAAVERPLPDWLAEGIERDWQMAQQLGVIEDIERLAAEGLTAQQTANELGERLALVDRLAAANNEPSSAPLKNNLIRSVRSRLGIPSMDEHTEYQRWLDGYRARTQPQQAAHQTTQDPAAPAFDPNQYLPRAQRYVREGSGRLTPEALGRHLGIEPQQAQQVLAALTATPDSGILVGRDGRLRRAPRTTGPMDVLRFLASRGGIRDDEGHDLRRSRDLQRLVPGHGPLIRPNGLHIDDAGEILWEAGYFGDPETTPRPGEREVLDLIERATRERVYVPEQAPDLETRPTWQQDQEDSVRQEIRAVGRDLGEVFSETDIRAIMDIMLEEDVDAEAAVGIFAERLAIQTAEEANREKPRDEYEIPFEPVADEQAGRDQGDEGDRGRSAGEPADAQQGEEGGPPPAETGGAQGQVARPPTTEQTDQGEQVVIPGAEQRPQGEILQQQMEGAARPTTPQQGIDGLELFDPDSRATAQQDLLDAPPQPEAAAPAQDSSTQEQLAGGFRRIRGTTNEAARTTDLGEGRTVLHNIRSLPQGHRLTASARFPGGITGAPSQDLGTFPTFEAAVEAADADVAQRRPADEQQGATADVVRQRIAEGREYARGVVGVGGVRRVWMIGSGVQRADARDVDLLYEIDGTLPEATADAEAAVEEMIGETRIDIDRYDTFIKVADRYFHVATGAGNAVVENTDYARDQAGRPRELLAEAEQPAEPTAEPVLTIADHSEKSIIITGQTRENIDRIKAAVPGVRPLWNRRAKGWIFPKKRESQVREALADLLGDAPQEPAASFANRSDLVAYLRDKLPEGYLVSRAGEGSPLEIYGPDGSRVRQIDGLPQRADMDAMIEGFRSAPPQEAPHTLDPTSIDPAGPRAREAFRADLAEKRKARLGYTTYWLNNAAAGHWFGVKRTDAEPSETIAPPRGEPVWNFRQAIDAVMADAFPEQAAPEGYPEGYPVGDEIAAGGPTPALRNWIMRAPYADLQQALDQVGSDGLVSQAIQREQENRQRRQERDRRRREAEERGWERAADAVDDARETAAGRLPVVDDRERQRQENVRRLQETEAQQDARPLYASRPVANAEDIIAWAREQGFRTTVPASEMHVTVAHSREPVDGTTVGASAPSETVTGGERSVEQLGDDGAVVLRIESQALTDRWQEYRDAGASWDFDSYKPHITITYQAGDLDLSNVEPYRGPIHLGEEAQEALDDSATDNMAEVPTAPAEPERPATYGASNTLVTQDRAEELRRRLREKLRGQLSSGVDPELIALGTELAVFHLEAGARRFADFARAIADDLGTAPENLRAYLRGWYNGARDMMEDSGLDVSGMDTPDQVRASLNTLIEEAGDAQRAPGSPERTGPADEAPAAARDIRDDGRGEGGRASAETRTPADRDGGRPGESVGDGRPDAAGERGNQPVPSEKSRLEQSAARDTDDPGSLPDSTGGLHADRETGSEPGSGAQAAPASIPRLNVSDRSTVEIGDLSQIKEQMPFLTDGQAEDVAFAERRFAKPNGFGVLFTNGTGTGKTFGGLGIGKRYAMQGKTNILIAVPKQTIADAWIRAGRQFFDLPISRLESTQDAGEGVVITTYANLGDNNALLNREWDLVIADEAHYLSSAQDGRPTAAERKLRAMTLKRRTARDRVYGQNADRVEEMRRLDSEARALTRGFDMPEAWAQGRALEERARTIRRELDEMVRQEQARLKAIPDADKPRAVFLSATPFSYEKSVRWANEFLFDWGADDGGAGYNVGGSYESFMMQHFGYRMRYNRLTERDSRVDRGLMQRAFNSWLQREGVLSGRTLDSDFDYDRRFVMADSAIGRRVDEAIDWMSEHSRGEDAIPGMRELHEAISDSFDYHSRMYFLEAIKAREAIPQIRGHIEQGRKVVVMHDFKKGGTANPFRVTPSPVTAEAYAAFQSAFSDLINAFETLPSPIETLTEAFPGALVYNGDVTARRRVEMQDRFNSDADDAPRLMIAQGDAMREGVSIHDTSGKFPRVMVHLGMPVRPTAAIQQEGRIYRTGQGSNAMFRYLTIGTNWERYAFASKIASRASAAENLAMGEQARGLKQAFITAYEDAGDFPPGYEGEGTGGRESDGAFAHQLTPWDMAKAFYFGTRKQGQGRSARGREHSEFFATPEPLGLKMVHWADIRGGERVLEPSAGHGAIARWFPENTTNRAIELTRDLASRLALNFDGDLLTGDFMDHNVVNKYDAIVMNPPFGSGGKQAIEHLAKAARHLRSGGRIVALLPRGGMADRRLEGFLESDEAANLYRVGTVDLPPSTFERAGTSVQTQVVILERHDDAATAPDSQRNVDLSNAGNIEELFERLEDIEMPARSIPEEATPAAEAAPAEAPAADPPSGFEVVEHVTQRGRTIRGIIHTGMTRDQAREIDPYTFRKTNEAGESGWFIRERHLGDPRLQEAGLQEGDEVYLNARTTFYRENESWQAALAAEGASPVSVRGNEIARDWTMRQGHADGFEHLIVNDINGGRTVEVGTVRDTDRVSFTPQLLAFVDDPRVEMVAHHNHPRNSALSPSDIATLGGGGLRLIFAHGSDGALTAARLTPEVRESLAPGSSGRMALGAIARAANDGVFRVIQEKIWERAVNIDDAQLLHPDMVNRALVQAGVIEYHTSLPMPEAPAFAEAVTAGARRARNAAKEFIPDARLLDGGSPIPVRADGDMARILGRDARDAEERRGRTARDPAGRADNRDQGRARGEAQVRRPEQLQLLEEQGAFREVTETPAFRRWFGDSKVVDADGEPMVMYHGTRPGNDIESFRTPDGDGAYFTPDPAYAEAFTADLFAEEGGENAGGMYPVYLSIQNPYIVRTEDGSDTFYNFVDRGLDTEELKAQGYDGAMLYVEGFGLDQVIAFRPEQVKSAIGNTGAFDPSDPRISYTMPDGWGTAEGGTVPRPRLSNTELAAVRGIIRRVSGLRDFEQVDTIPIEPGSRGAREWGRPEGGGTAGGAYSATRDVITLAMDSASPRGAYHESFHRLQDLFLTDREKAALAADHDRLRDLLKREGVRSADQVNRMSGSEVEAESFAAFATAKAEGQSITGFPMRARMALAKIERVVRAVRNWLRGRGYQTWEDVFERAAAGEVARRLPRDAQGRFVSPSAITDTPEFRRWFADSKVVDESGNPLVVYHGTRSRFEAFEVAPTGARRTYDIDADRGFFFSSSRQVAQTYAADTSRSERLASRLGRGGRVEGVYLQIQNPMEMDMRHGEYDARVFADTIDAAKEAGHDGVVFRNVWDDGFRDSGEASDVWVAFRPQQIKAVDNRGSFDPEDARMRYSVNEPIRPERNFPLRNPGRNAPTARNGAEARRRAMNQWLGMQPLDQAFRLPFHLFGGIDQRGEWNWGRYLNQQAERIITNAKFSDESRFAWINPALQKARAGLLDRYGLDPAYIERERQRGLDERRILSQVPEIMQMLDDQNIGTEEAKVLHAVLTGEEVADAEMAKLAEPIRNAIDDMGAEAVRYGLLSPEAYERNRGAYLHRVYQKHENDMGGLTRWVSRSMASQRKKIIGEQFKGRGLWIEVPMSRLMRDMPGFREAQRGEAVKGERLRVLDRVEHSEQEELRGISSSVRKRVLDRVYLSADAAVPAKFADYADRGVWEVRGQKGGKVVLWRDFTREERQRMGEIVDARYTIAKTYMQMAHDLAVGKFYHDIAQNEDWSQAKEPAQGKAVDAHDFGRFDRVGSTEVEWVKVPDTKIANSQTKRYGALAGRYLRAEIWRDIQELERMQNPTFWNQALTQWKLNKTARNPVVHMNNVMSNLALMDLADVRSSDLVNAIASMVNRDDAFLEAQENGAFGSDMVAVEIRRNTLQPILERIQRESQGGRNTIESKLGLLGRLADGIWGFAKGLDRRMVELYQLEDEVFRMATYLRKRDLGFSPTEAALQARDQFLNYDIRAPWVNAARRSVLPFISYTYRAVPVVAQSVMLRPWKLAKYATIAYAANALAYMVLGDDGDEDEERRSLRSEEQGSTWLGAPRMMRLPWNDDYGNPVFLDVRRWVPAGDIFDMNQGQSAIPVPAPLQFGGPLMLAGEFILNRQAFTGQEITNDLTDDWWDKSAKVTDWAWKSWMPSAPWIPGSWYWNRIGNAMSGARDFRGRPYSVPQAALSSAGIKVKSQDVRQGFYFHGLEFNRVEQELRAQMRRLARDRQRGLITERRFERERVRLITKMRRLGERRRQVFQGSD